MAWYKAGSVTATLNSTSVSGVGTKFATNARVGDGFRGPDGYWYEITNIASETTLAIYPAYQGATVSASANYVIAPLQGYVKESADRLRQITDQIQDVQADVVAADGSAKDAATSALASASSATAASTSAGNAATSATNAKTSENNAKTSETNAGLSKTQAGNSATAADASKTAAATSATNAGTSATNASASATAALGSQNAAKGSETASATSAAAALASQNAAKTSETNSKTSETNAAGSATTASTQATNSGNSATAANASKVAAATSETNSKTSETNSKASELKAKAWADTAVDTPVETGKFSALHWAAKAKSSADQAAGVNGPRLTSIAGLVMAVNDILIADTTTTMKALATTAIGRTLLGATDSLTGRNALQLGTAATSNVTTSSNDLTVGRVMQVGDFGWGVGNNGLNAMAFPSNGSAGDIDLATTSGVYRVVNGNVNIPAPFGQGAVVLVLTWNNATASQMITQSGKTAFRYGTNLITTPSWTPWTVTVGVGDFNIGVANPAPVTFSNQIDWAKPNGWSGFINLGATNTAGISVPKDGTALPFGYGSWTILGKRDNSDGYTGLLSDYATGKAYIGYSSVGTSAAQWRELITMQAGAVLIDPGNANNAGLELGNKARTNTPFIDFNSSAGGVDYDSRIIASGGSTTIGAGALTYTAGGGHFFNGPLTVNSGFFGTIDSSVLGFTQAASKNDRTLATTAYVTNALNAGRPKFTEVSVLAASGNYGVVQGMHIGWNASGTQGEGNFIVNRGGGSGGFTWRSITADNSASGPTMTYSYDGILSVSQVSITGTPLGVSSGGTGTNASTGTGSLVLATSPALAGTPTAPTAAANAYDTRLATTAFVRNCFIGTVGLSGSTPTGAIIQQGASGSSQYTRFADGTQICRGISDQLAINIASGSGNITYSNAAVFGFPLAFAAVPAVIIGTETSNGFFTWGASEGPATTTQVVGRAVSMATNATTYLNYIAVGRWV